MNAPDPDPDRLLVVKVGGSLLDWDGLPDRLRALLNDRHHERLVIVVGGGTIVDRIRALDSIHQLGEERAHKLAMRGLELTAHVLAELLAELQLVDTPDSLAPVWECGRFPLVNIGRILATDNALEETWSVTSDSLAARLAVRLQATELLLLKSAAIPPGTDREVAARFGLVDPAFPEVSAPLGRVFVRNFRDPTGESVELRRRAAKFR